eukprot:c17434_g1_i1.p1 GENE.c17434_g1_i1~~c17434_g1_i1.p1  ORF type:complete len:487 (+),score=209.47 c17434_g1_i1:66-1526(+)
MADKLESLVQRLEKAVERLEKQPGSGGSSASGSAKKDSGDDVVASVAEFDRLLSTKLTEALESGRALGSEDLTAQLALVEKAFRAERDFILVASKSKKPVPTALPGVLSPLQKAISAINDGGKRNDFTNHLKAVADGIGSLGWVAVEPAPVPFISEMSSSFMFHGNKILREFKGKDDKHVEFVNKFKDLFNELGEYVKEHHKTGLTWNPNGRDAKEVQAELASAPAASSAPAPAAPAAGVPVPPPPPSVADLLAAVNAAVAPKPASADTAGLFAAINSGNVTSGLKKVTDDMKTHKNPNLRASAVVPAKEAPAAEVKEVKAATPAANKPARVALDGKTWWIENQVSNKEIVLDDTNVKQSVFISGCVDCVISVKGKVNQITIENSSKSGVVFESVVAAVDIVNSKKVQLQCTGVMASLNIDKVHDTQIYLSAECLGVSIITSLSSDVSILLPGETADQDLTEQPIPYQFQTRIVNGKLITETVRHE